MFAFRSNHCPNCKAPNDGDAATCPYCYADIPDSGGELTIGGILLSVAVIGGLAIDWYFGGHVVGWLTQFGEQVSVSVD